jgi:UDPglucose 6-dehydrogenase
MKIVVVGTGYVGLITGVCLATKGHSVVCIDHNLNIVNKLNNGYPHIHETGLDELLKFVIQNKFFKATVDLKSSILECDGVIIAVGTPSLDGKIDLSQIEDVILEITEIIELRSRFLPIIIKSTVLPSTTDTFIRNILESRIERKHFGLGMNPEFLREGDAISDFMMPDRIVLGYDDDNVKIFLEELYSVWDCDKLYVNTRTAEMIKYSNNVYLANLISMSNELAMYAKSIGGIDMLDIVNGVVLDKRWSPIVQSERLHPQILNYLVPGCGYGGSCFPKDVAAINYDGKKMGLDMSITEAVISVNSKQPYIVIDILESNLNLVNANILILGLSFKENTDDVRESASIKIIEKLLERKANVFAHDPIAQSNFKRLIPPSENLTYVDKWSNFVSKVEAILILTKWEEYLELELMNLEDIIIFDARRIFKKNMLKSKITLTI